MASPINDRSRASDADLLTRVGIALMLRFQHALRSVEPHVAESEVTLRGELPNFYQRQLAIEVVRRVAGVRRVHDQLTVRTTVPSVAPVTQVAILQVEEERERQREVAAGQLSAARESTDRSPRLSAAVLPVPAPAGLFRSGWAVAAALVLAVLAGCGQKAADRTPVFPASGSITVKGLPAHGAIVVLHPKNAIPAPNGEGAPAPRANVDEQGAFDVTTYDRGDGAPEGEYVVTVMWFKQIKENGDLKAGPNVVPAKYSRPSTSDIVVKIAAGQNSLPPIKL